MNLAVIISTLVRNFTFDNFEGKEGVPETDFTSLFAHLMLSSYIWWERRFPQSARAIISIPVSTARSLKLRLF